jgi:uncharacterized membrane protein
VKGGPLAQQAGSVDCIGLCHPSGIAGGHDTEAWRQARPAGVEWGRSQAAAGTVPARTHRLRPAVEEETDMSASPAFVQPGAFSQAPPIRRIGTADLLEALKRGIADFSAMPTHLAFVGLIYPVVGVILATLAFGYDLLPLIFPLVSGFALLGPVAAVGLYELSRRRELGMDTGWHHAVEVVRAPAIGSIVALGLLLLVIFAAWLLCAWGLYVWLFGSAMPSSIGGFLGRVLGTTEGWMLIVLGHALGLIFAAVVLSISVVSFPLLIDRNVGAGVAVQTSWRAVKENPVPMALWGAIVAVFLIVGSAPLLVGLAVVMPILGHATWHLYRRVVAS